MRSEVCKESIPDIEMNQNHVKHDLITDSFTACRDVKYCSGCKTNHSLDNFYPKGNRYDSKCRTCIGKVKKNKRVIDNKKRAETKKRRNNFCVVDIIDFEIVQIGDHDKEELSEIFKNFLRDVNDC